VPIFDQGYQHWTGQLSGHFWRWLTIARHGLRAGMKGKILLLAMIVGWLPAVLLAVILCAWGLIERKSELVSSFQQALRPFGPEVVADPRLLRVEVWTIAYQYFMSVELTISMILILIAGPSLISQDLRFNAMPLYFSRPLRRIDYFLGKLGVIVALVAMIVVVPSLIAYALGLLFSLDLSIVRDTFPLLLSVIAYGLVIAVSAGMFILALSSLSRNSLIVGLMWVGIWFVSNMTSSVLELIYRFQQMEPFMHARDDRPVDMQAEFASMLEASKSDWRPAVSYTQNLARVGQQLMETDACWRKLFEPMPKEEREMLLFSYSGRQYPWYWSAGVLAALFGLSTCILRFRVRSLDRLK